MNFDKPSARNFRAKAAKELSREELLAKVNTDRAIREANRHRSKAAVTIQRLYRGWIDRTAVRHRLIDKWLKQYSTAAADVSCYLSATELSDSVLPPLLHVFNYLGPENQSRQPGIWLAGAAALRGTLALLLRSIASQKQELNFCALCNDTSFRWRWQRQSCGLLLLCCAVLRLPIGNSGDTSALQPNNPWAASPSSGQAQLLLQTAAARMLMVLTDASLWKSFEQGDLAASNACQNLISCISTRPTIHLAVRSLLTTTPNINPTTTTTTPTVRSSPPPSQQESSPAQAAVANVGPQAQSPEEQKQAMIIQMTMHAVLRLLTAYIPNSPASISDDSKDDQSPMLHQSAGVKSSDSRHPSAAVAAAHFACSVITAPQLLSQLPAAAHKELTHPPILMAIMTAMQHVTSTQGCTPQAEGQGAHLMGQVNGKGLNINGKRLEGNGKGPGLDGVEADGGLNQLLAIKLDGALDAMRALGNLASLLSGKRVRKASKDGRTIQYVPRSQLLEVPGIADNFLATATLLITFALNNQQGSQPLTGLKEAAEGLWPLTEGTFITQLLDSSGSATTAVAAVAAFYHLLLEGLFVLAGGPEQGSPIVSALAFGCNIMPRLWRWCAMTMGLPLEAPKEATRGWDVPTLKAGAQGLDPEHVPKLGLFCRVYAHALLVLDDTDFYECQNTFTLSQQRGIATALNALVFRTYCPSTSGAHTKKQQPSNNMPLCVPPTRMLTEWAPVLLRALYERNVRRQYCPSSLWLEPFHATQAAQEGQFSAGALVRALSQGHTPLPSLSPGRGAGGWPGAQAGLLGTAPQCIPFEQRLLVFRALVAADKDRGRWDKPPSEGGPAPLKFTVHRGSLLQNGWAALHNAGEAVKGRLVVSFVNEQGMLEAGLDYGGLVKEFLEQAISTGFDANYGLFTSTPDGFAYPQPAATKLPNGLGLLEFLGLVVGKALYEGILLDLPLAPFFVARLQGRRPMFDELAALDSELYRSLMQLKRYEGDATQLALDFSVEDDTFGARNVHSLMPGGADMVVTNSNKLHYIHLAADWHLNGRLAASSAAFARGMTQVIPPGWLKLFNAQEVNQLLGGGESGVMNVYDMAMHSQYSGGYSKDHPTVKIFWKVMTGLTDKEQQAFMRFVTSCSRAPLGGFRFLNPPLTIHKVPCEASLLAVVGGKDVDRLPSASTCYNMLKLPNYRRASTLKDKLLYAISSNAGFELS